MVNEHLNTHRNKTEAASHANINMEQNYRPPGPPDPSAGSSGIPQQNNPTVFSPLDHATIKTRKENIKKRRS